MKRVFFFLTFAVLTFLLVKTASAAGPAATGLWHTPGVCHSSDSVWVLDFHWIPGATTPGPIQWLDVSDDPNATNDPLTWIITSGVPQNFNNWGQYSYSTDHVQSVTLTEGHWKWRINTNYATPGSPDWSVSQMQEFDLGPCGTTPRPSPTSSPSSGGNIGDWFLFGAGGSIKGAFSNVGSFASVIIMFLFGIAALIAFIMLLVGSVKFIFSGGDVEAAAGAKNTITYAIIGLVLVICAFAIVRVLEVVLGYKII